MENLWIGTVAGIAIFEKNKNLYFAFEKATELYKELFSDSPAEYFNPYITCLEQLKDYKEAEKVLKKMNGAVKSFGIK